VITTTKTIKGVVFDWAGTTVDYGCMAPVHVMVDLFRSIDIEPTMEEVRAPMGYLKWDHIKAMLDMPRIGEAFRSIKGRAYEIGDIDELHNQFEPMLLSTLHQFADPLPMVRETIAALREQGLSIGSTTGYNNVMMQIITKTAEGNGYAPDYWVTADAVGGRGRPFPYMIFSNIIKLDMGTPDCVVKVGDTASDMQEARAAGVWAVGVLRGSSMLGLTEEEVAAMDEEQLQAREEEAKQKFMQSGAHAVIETMAELPVVIEEINRCLEKGGNPSGYQTLDENRRGY